MNWLELTTTGIAVISVALAISNGNALSKAQAELDDIKARRSRATSKGNRTRAQKNRAKVLATAAKMRAQMDGMAEQAIVDLHSRSAA